MKKHLDWRISEVVNVFDELSLWSAPFGRMLLENLPMSRGSKIVDIGFGTGFPLIELSQRFGDGSFIYGIDIWKKAISRAKQKISIFELTNIQILETDASQINIDSKEIDLVTSNLGVNNFEKRLEVYAEIERILKVGGKLCITTNPVGTFEELFDIFEQVFHENSLAYESGNLRKYICDRGTEESIISEIEDCGLRLTKSVSDSTSFRFVDAQAVLDHALMRIGFRVGWDALVRAEWREFFYKNLISKIAEVIDAEGEFKMTVPMLYLEFEK